MNQTFTKIITSAAIVCCSFLAFATNEPNYPNGFTPKTLSGISFTENKGQVSDQYFRPRPDVLFGGTDGNLVFHLKNNGISYQLNKIDTWKDVEDIRTKEKRKEIDKSTIYRLDINWLNANTHARVVKGAAYEGYNNYYLETCPNGALNVQSFEDVTYQNIYSGIDLKWYQKDGHLKYDYIVAAGANYKNIQLQIKGASNIKINKKGELIISTPLGDIIEHAPLVIQNQKVLKAKWFLKKTEATASGDIELGQSVSFEIENLNPNQAFVIDPAVRAWGTYYGGNNYDEGYSCITDASSNVYLAGVTNSNGSSIIATVGAHQVASGGGRNFFLVKFNSVGMRQWGTYYGGTGTQYQCSCTSDASGNLFLVGWTGSTNGTSIATAGAHQPAHGGGLRDAFLVKFNSAGVRQWGTYYGGNLDDFGLSCASDANGNVYLSGLTTSSVSNAIVTSGAHQSTYSGAGSAFLVKFNASGVRQWGTYYGNAGEIGFSCATDVGSNVYMAGSTDSYTGTVIATTAAHQFTSLGGDAFLVKFNSAGVRQWGTYYGGTGYEIGYSCATDLSGNVFLAGETDSNNGTSIATAGAHQTAFGGGLKDAFLVKFDATGIRLWGTYYGSSGWEEGRSCATDPSGNIYLAGRASLNTGTVIATASAHQTNFGGGNYDAFLVKFNSSGLRQRGTYYGGSGDEWGYSCSCDANGNVYLAGYTESNTGTDIATTGSHQSAHGGGVEDAFLVKFLDCSGPPANPSGNNQSSCINTTFTLTAASGTAIINWYATASSTIVLGTGTSFVTPSLSIGTYTYYAEAYDCVSSVSRTAISITVNTIPTVNAISSASVICVGESATLTASGATSYLWSNGSSLSANIVSPTVTTSYTVNGTDVNGCSNVSALSQSVAACTNIYTRDNSTSLISIYPNPNNGQFQLVSESPINLTLMNDLGQVLKTISLNESNKNTVSFNEFDNGIYFIVGQNNNQVIKQKVVVDK